MFTTGVAGLGSSRVSGRRLAHETARGLFTFTPEKYPALTGVRAVAAYLVFLHHFASNPKISGPFCEFLWQGHIGVALFYVLSGFLITLNYSKKADLKVDYWIYYISRRIGRIYPLYLSLLVATYVVLARLNGTHPSTLSLALNLTLWKGFFDDFKFDGIGPSWSLTVEETFYLLAPFIFVAVRKVGHIAVLVLLYVIGGLSLWLGSHWSYYGFFGNFHFVALYTFFGRSFEFMLGMALAHALQAYPSLLATSRRPTLTYLGLGGCVSVMFWMSLPTRGASFSIAHPYGLVLNNVVLPPFIGILICGLVAEQTFVSRILSSRLGVFLGRTSYAFYLLHFGVLADLISSWLGSYSTLLPVAVLFVLTNILAALLFLLVERPANALVRRLGDRLAAIYAASRRNPNPSLRLRRLAVVWSGSFAIVFAIWCAMTLDWRSITALESSLTGETSRVQIEIPEFARPVAAHTGFGRITSRKDQLVGLTLAVGGQAISEKNFIFAHANSRLEYELPRKKWSRFEFSTGLDDVGGADVGSVVYVVRGDGAELFRSPVIRPLEQPHSYSVSVTNITRLELLITDAGNGCTNDEAYWIEPNLR